MRRLVAAVEERGGRWPVPGGELAERVLERERQMSTGLEQGVALPHAMFPGSFPTAGALALIPDGLDFACLDGEPARFLLLMAFSDDEEGRRRHVALLGQSIRLFTDPGLAGELLRASDPAAALELIRRAEGDKV
ncbi:MAG: PTS sugar transporter subunit IIA [Planctomycetota bacterium]